MPVPKRSLASQRADSVAAQVGAPSRERAAERRIAANYAAADCAATRAPVSDRHASVTFDVAAV